MIAHIAHNIKLQKNEGSILSYKGKIQHLTKNILHLILKKDIKLLEPDKDMDENDFVAVAILGIILVGFFVVIILNVLSTPITGHVAGYQMQLPFVGWISVAAFIVFALFLYFRYRA